MMAAPTQAVLNRHDFGMVRVAAPPSAKVARKRFGFLFPFILP